MALAPTVTNTNWRRPRPQPQGHLAAPNISRGPTVRELSSPARTWHPASEMDDNAHSARTALRVFFLRAVGGTMSQGHRRKCLHVARCRMMGQRRAAEESAGLAATFASSRERHVAGDASAPAAWTMMPAHAF